jgi:hypothetical protein
MAKNCDATLLDGYFPVQLFMKAKIEATSAIILAISSRTFA